MKCIFTFRIIPSPIYAALYPVNNAAGQSASRKGEPYLLHHIKGGLLLRFRFTQPAVHVLLDGKRIVGLVSHDNLIADNIGYLCCYFFRPFYSSAL